ncbi:hypothetical protein LIER_13664 [Lithospermum erythrorhizon]|uniref:RNase H type-1 domain-containing protein n=1 Tax=Lithospermum erythrorhizon TaxID=34254 RepID=A0AAV3PYR7_LITER
MDVFVIRYGSWEHVLSKLGIKILRLKRFPPLAFIWQKPIEGVLKLNVDGSYVHQGQDGEGGIFRDHRSKVLKAFTHQFHAVSAFHLELLVVYDGLQICSDLGWMKVIIKTDSMQVIDNVIKRRGAWHLNHLVDKITNLLTRNEHTIQHVMREVNSVADQLAKKPIEGKGMQVLEFGQIPSDIRTNI